MTFSRHYLAQRATLDAVDLAEMQGCRRAHNQLGFAYQVGFVRLLNRFPKQEPFEVLDELPLFTGVQLGVDSTLIEEYRRRRQTISEHQQRITRYRRRPAVALTALACKITPICLTPLVLAAVASTPFH